MVAVLDPQGQHFVRLDEKQAAMLRDRVARESLAGRQITLGEAFDESVNWMLDAIGAPKAVR